MGAGRQFSGVSVVKVGVAFSLFSIFSSLVLVLAIRLQGAVQRRRCGSVKVMDLQLCEEEVLQSHVVLDEDGALRTAGCQDPS